MLDFSASIDRQQTLALIPSHYTYEEKTKVRTLKYIQFIFRFEISSFSLYLCRIFSASQFSEDPEGSNSDDADNVIDGNDADNVIDGDDNDDADSDDDSENEAGEEELEEEDESSSDEVGDDE